MKPCSHGLQNLLPAALLTLMFHYSAFSQGLTVSITSPADGSHIDPCADITVTAEASIETGEIAKVEFYKNGDLARTDTRTPYEMDMRNVPTGLYQFIAKAIDDADNEVSSDPVRIYVGNVEEGNLLINGEFDCSLSPWRLDQYV